jgi:uncharacterized membrane protein (UPF0127 family)
MLVKLSSRDSNVGKGLSVVTVRIGNNIAYCEVPGSDQEQKIGLKNRDFLATHRGMLFYTHGRYMPLFTMNSVFFDLDAIFVGNDSKIKDIVTMKKLDGSTAYTSSKRVPIKYVIELGGGVCKRNGIKVGDTVYIN